MYTAVLDTVVYARVQINGGTHDEVMCNVGVKQGCLLSLSPMLFAT